MTTLDRRISAIERKVFGEASESFENPDLKNRLVGIESQVLQAESSIQDLSYIKSNASKYSIFLNERRIPMQQMAEKAEWIQATRFEIERNLSHLSIIKDSAAIVDADVLSVASENDGSLLKRVIAMELSFGAYMKEIELQTKEMDLLLDQYDSLMTALSEKTASWDNSLLELEKAKQR